MKRMTILTIAIVVAIGWLLSCTIVPNHIGRIYYLISPYKPSVVIKKEFNFSQEGNIATFDFTLNRPKFYSLWIINDKPIENKKHNLPAGSVEFALKYEIFRNNTLLHSNKITSMQLGLFDKYERDKIKAFTFDYFAIPFCKSNNLTIKLTVEKNLNFLPKDLKYYFAIKQSGGV